MILGQPCLFSQSAHIKYIHGLGMKIQLGGNGEWDRRSILINLILVDAPSRSGEVLKGTAESRNGVIIRKVKPEYVSELHDVFQLS